MQTKIGKALVIGGGISGIRSALDLAEFGYGVTLIDRAPHMGGILSQLDYQFPTDRCGMCKMLPLVERDAGSQFCLRKGLFHENIDIHLSTELAAVEGEPGQFNCHAAAGKKPGDPGPLHRLRQVRRCLPGGYPTVSMPAVHPARPSICRYPHSFPMPTHRHRRLHPVRRLPTPAPPARSSLMDEGRNFNILVVDDELIVRDSLKEWLVDEGGSSVDMAASGPDALEHQNAMDAS
jgi:heterodisulfide reductase subunit A